MGIGHNSCKIGMVMQDKIRKKAQEIALKFNPEGMTPFPFEKLQEQIEDLDIYIVDLEEGVSGVISFDKDANEFSVFVHEDDPEPKRNFTIAHELGHYYLHASEVKRQEVLVDYSQKKDPTSGPSKMDQEADLFASELLIPEQLAFKAWSDLNDIGACAEVFNVPIGRMVRRLSNLGLFQE